MQRWALRDIQALKSNHQWAYFSAMLKQIRPLMLVWFGTLEHELHPVKPLIARLKSKVGNETSAKPNSW
jgi:hypothetical protein